MMRVVAIVLLALVVASCGGGPAQGPRMASAVIINTVTIGFTRDPDELPFDPRAARLNEATQQLTAIAGHPIAFQFDIALLPQWHSSFEYALIEAVENVARALHGLRQYRPAAFAYAGPALRRIEWHYVAVPSDDAGFDASTGTLRIPLSSEASGFVSSDFVERTMVDAWSAWQSTRFAGVEPEQADDVAAYLQWLTDQWRSSSDRKSPDYPANDPRAGKIERVARLFPRIPPSTAEKAPYLTAMAWLAKREDYFVTAYQDYEDAVRRAPPGSAFRRAEAAWVAWLNGNIDKLDDRQRLDVVGHLLVERRHQRDRGESRFVDIAFPGFDFVGYALRVADEWAAAGHPMRFDERPDRQHVFVAIVCPSSRDSSGRQSVYGSCDHVLYRYAAENDAAKKRLSAYVSARNDTALTESVFASLAGLEDGYPLMLSMWRALEPNPAQWRVAASVIAEQVTYIKEKKLLLDEAQRLWRARPGARGPILYLLAQLHRERETIDWANFARTFGSLATKGDFEGFLDQGDSAMEMVGDVWRSLGPAWSRASSIVPRLDRYLASQRAQGRGARTVDEIAAQLCAEGSGADVVQLRAYVEQRAHNHASEERDFEPVLYRFTSQCPAAHTAADRAQGPRPGTVLFGN